ncbi:Gfo/Idh/MocA family protein [Halorarum salinum]|uniref:Gfo/Idh/MocA family oxidoreductase n=1 Tax=Halorarum salinum TaxID=2743089 RepID=A0A7D5LB77_9EURY|nr:Gfo/Idh/MocA family oxidoreductase [Halobaculum salinum]QLG62633.1 Gfo/Idh/MocA family oxidoreductase [Halobaculum salinum]
MTNVTDVPVGIIGLGGIGNYHAERLIRQGGNLVGGMDVDPEARRRFADAHGVETFDDAEGLYEVADAVLVTTPNSFHEKYAVSALEAGLDVLLEKPLAHSLESAEIIARTARTAPGFCMVGFNNRFSAAAEVLTHYREEGRFGEIRHVEANFIRQRGIPGRGSWFTTDEVSGGGALVDIGVHAIDLGLHFMDFPEIAEVSGVARSQFGGRDDYAYVEMWGDDEGPAGFDVDDSVSAFVRSTEGHTLSLEAAWATNRPACNDFYVRGTEGGAHFDRGTGELTLYESGTGGTNHLSETSVSTRELDTHEAEQAAFLEAVATGEPPARNTVDQALTVQRVVDGIYRSDETGRAVQLGSEPVAHVGEPAEAAQVD